MLLLPLTTKTLAAAGWPEYVAIDSQSLTAYWLLWGVLKQIGLWRARLYFINCVGRKQSVSMQLVDFVAPCIRDWRSIFSLGFLVTCVVNDAESQLWHWFQKSIGLYIPGSRRVVLVPREIRSGLFFFADYYFLWHQSKTIQVLQRSYVLHFAVHFDRNNEGQFPSNFKTFLRSKRRVYFSGDVQVCLVLQMLVSVCILLHCI